MPKGNPCLHITTRHAKEIRERDEIEAGLRKEIKRLNEHLKRQDEIIFNLKFGKKDSA